MHIFNDLQFFYTAITIEHNMEVNDKTINYREYYFSYQQKLYMQNRYHKKIYYLKQNHQ